MMNRGKINYDMSGSEMLDCDVCGNFSNVTGQPVYNETPEDYELLIEEYKKSGSKKTFNDWLSSDSSKSKYIKSGSKKTFKEWIKEDSNKSIISSIATIGSTIGAAFLAGQNVGNKDVLNNNKDTNNGTENTNKPNWMLISSLLVGGLALTIGGIFLIKKIKK